MVKLPFLVGKSSQIINSYCQISMPSHHPLCQISPSLDDLNVANQMPGLTRPGWAEGPVTWLMGCSTVLWVAWDPGEHHFGGYKMGWKFDVHPTKVWCTAGLDPHLSSPSFKCLLLQPLWLMTAGMFCQQKAAVSRSPSSRKWEGWMTHITYWYPVDPIHAHTLRAS